MVGEDVLKETLARLDLPQGLKEKAQDAPHSKTLGLKKKKVVTEEVVFISWTELQFWNFIN